MSVFGGLEKIITGYLGRELEQQETDMFLGLIKINSAVINFGAIGIEYQGLDRQEASLLGINNSSYAGHRIFIYFPPTCDVPYKSKIKRFLDMRDPLGR